LKIGNLSTQLSTQLHSEIDEIQGLSSQAGYDNGGIKSLGPPKQDPH